MENSESLQEKQKKHETESAADLEKVTDYAEDKEISVTDIGSILANLSKTNKEECEREKQLAAVKISKSDVELIMNELDIQKKLAERTLREHNGDVVQALMQLVQS